MLLTSSIPPMRCLCLFIAQMLACMFSSLIVSVILPTPFGVVTQPSHNTTTAQAVCLELILTAYLCMSIFMLAGENHKGRFMAPVCIGMALFSAHLVGVQWTGASLNPCRSFGPAVVSGNWNGQWIYCEYPPFFPSVLRGAWADEMQGLDRALARRLQRACTRRSSICAMRRPIRARMLMMSRSRRPTTGGSRCTGSRGSVTCETAANDQVCVFPLMIE